MSQAGASGGYTVTLQTIDAQTNLLQSLAVTGISLADSPTTIALKSQAQLTTQLSQYGILYSGSPVFTSNGIIDFSNSPNLSSQLGMATFRITQSDGILCFFSEANFILTISNDTTSSNATVSDVPLLATLAQITSDGPIAGLVLETVDGTSLTQAQIISLVEAASAKLISILNNKVVICTYIHEDIGFWQRSFFLREGIPGIYFDGVRVKPSSSIQWFGVLVGASLSLAWNYVRTTGELNYIASQNLVSTYEPSGMGNEIKISYVAGNFHIPKSIIYGVISLMTSILENKGDIAELKTGTWSVKFKDDPLIDRLREELSQYGLWF